MIRRHPKWLIPPSYSWRYKDAVNLQLVQQAHAPDYKYQLMALMCHECNFNLEMTMWQTSMTTDLAWYLYTWSGCNFESQTTWHGCALQLSPTHHVELTMYIILVEPIMQTPWSPKTWNRSWCWSLCDSGTSNQWVDVAHILCCKQIPISTRLMA